MAKLVKKYLFGKNIVKTIADKINEYGNREYTYNRAKPYVYYDIVRAQMRNEGKSELTDSKEFNSRVKTLINKNKVHTGKTNSQQAAKTAAFGQLASFFPVYGKAISIATSMPDVVYDWAAAISEPKPSNIAHVSTNHLEDAAKVLTPGFKYDDYIAKGLGILGNVDDALSGEGIDMFGWMNKSTNKK